MKKIFIVTLLFVSLSSYASSEFEFRLGPKINVKNSVTQFGAGLGFGGEYLKFIFDYAYGRPASLTAHAIRVGIMFDIPFYFDIGEQSSFGIVPTFDFGPQFIFVGGVKMINFTELGFGLKTKYYFNESMGVAFTPVHMSLSFASYTTGGIGIVKQLQMTYNLWFSFLFRW